MLIDHFKKHSRDPLLLFTVVGVLIFTLYYSLEESYQPTIRLSSTIRVQLIEDFEAITGRKVTPERIAQLEKDFITDEILFRDAISAGMHLIDPATRSILIEKCAFASVHSFKNYQILSSLIITPKTCSDITPRLL
jgi:hypothetical protein